MSTIMIDGLPLIMGSFNWYLRYWGREWAVRVLREGHPVESRTLEPMDVSTGDVMLPFNYKNEYESTYRN